MLIDAHGGWPGTFKDEEDGTQSEKAAS